MAYPPHDSHSIRKAQTKVSTTIWLYADLLTALKATGEGWQTRLKALVQREVMGRPEGHPLHLATPACGFSVAIEGHTGAQPGNDVAKA
ncbi:MAG: hypothetical protein EOP02_08560 [Proteobacteria bacterium]|nr:MAG: hypothetical protein EOP02_08560 [Pseudomonadota bacterium]